MENNNYIIFKKQRDIGSIINDTFKFLRLEWKPFFGYVFKIAIIPILLAVAAMIYYTYESSKFFSSIDFLNPTTFTSEIFFSNSSELFFSSFLLMTLYLIAYVFVNISSLYYVKSYIENKGIVNFEEIKRQADEKFWAFIGLGILTAVITFVSVFLFILPVIYTSVVLSLASSLLVFENKSVSQAIGDSFNFVKGHWWETFGVFIVISFIVSILGFMISTPVLIYQSNQILTESLSLINPENSTILLTMFSDPIYIFLNVLVSAAQFLLHSITLIATVLIYFDIYQQKTA